MDMTPYRRTESLVVEATPEVIYDLVADVSRMGEWSPVSTGGAYDDDGVWFTGHNAAGSRTWSTRCRVIVADRPHEFAFINHGVEGHFEMVRWGYTLRPVTPTTTELIESWEVLPTYADGFFAVNGPGQAALEERLAMMKGLAESSMPATLEMLGAAARDAGRERR
jgi:hypothetical protein